MWTGEIIKVTSEGDAEVVTELPAIMDQHPDLGYIEFLNGLILALHLGNDVLYAVDPNSGFYKVVIGKEREGGYVDGGLDEARFEDPIGIVSNESENILYITDGIEGEQRLRKVDIGPGGHLLPDFKENPVQKLQIAKPSESIIELKAVSNKKTVSTIEIRDAMDKIVDSTSWELENDENSTKIDISGWAKGLYFVTTKTENGFTRTYKVERK
jgi:hypothetical protein